MPEQQEQAGPPADVWEAKLAIMASVGYIRKSGKVKTRDKTGTLYTFAGEGDLLRAVRPLMIDNRLVMTCKGVMPWPGAPTQSVRALFHFVFRHVPSKTEDSVYVLGEGGDQGDKCCPKANTIAAKYALRIWLQLETGDDPDRAVQDGRDGKAKETGPQPAKKGRESFERCKAALKKAPDLATLDKYRAIYQAGRGYSDAEVAELEDLYADRMNTLGGRTSSAPQN